MKKKLLCFMAAFGLSMGISLPAAVPAYASNNGTRHSHNSNKQSSNGHKQSNQQKPKSHGHKPAPKSYQSSHKNNGHDTKTKRQSSKPTSKSSDHKAKHGSAPFRVSHASMTTNPEGTHGNNGTIKIDGTPFDSHPNNEPHVGCTFQVDFYNYDQGDDVDASVVFTAHSPTGSGVLLTDHVELGEDAAGGGHDLDAARTYNLMSALSGYTAHPKQGYHVKVTVDTKGTNAAGKHKVFWIKCGQGITPPPTGGNGGGPVTTVTPPSVGGRGGFVLGAQTAVASQPTVATAIPSVLPDTGSPFSNVAFFLFLLGIIAGTGIVLGSNRYGGDVRKWVAPKPLK